MLLGTQSILFPGQGSQEANMGRDLAEHWPEAMDLWKKAEQICGLPLREIYWDTDQTAMAETKNLQPALTVVNMNLWTFLASKLKAKSVAGHSLGEFSALFAARVLSLDQCLQLVCLRGKLMDEVCNQEGSMAAILKLSQTQVEDLVTKAHQKTGQAIRIANFNTPAQFVISGHVQAVEHVCAAVKPLKGRAMVLPVCNAFHSPYMQEAGVELARYMDKMDWKDPVISLYLNVTALPEPCGQKVLETMKAQMTSSVHWIQTITHQYDSGLRTFIELGPKGVLARMTGQIFQGKEEVRSLSVSSLEQAQGLEESLA